MALRESSKAWWLAGVIVFSLAAGCTSPKSDPPVDPEAVAVSGEFAEALRTRNLTALQTFFSDVVVVDDPGYAGTAVKGVDVTRENLTKTYVALFEKVSPSDWSRVIENRRPLLNPALHDGHHFRLAKAGDYVFEMGRPGSAKVEHIFVFVFRRIDGKYKLVSQSADFQ